MNFFVTGMKEPSVTAAGRASEPPVLLESFTLYVETTKKEFLFDQSPNWWNGRAPHKAISEALTQPAEVSAISRLPVGFGRPSMDYFEAENVL